MCGRTLFEGRRLSPAPGSGRKWQRFDKTQTCDRVSLCSLSSMCLPCLLVRKNWLKCWVNARRGGAAVHFQKCLECYFTTVTHISSFEVTADQIKYETPKPCVVTYCSPRFNLELLYEFSEMFVLFQKISNSFHLKHVLGSTYNHGHMLELVYTSLSKCVSICLPLVHIFNFNMN